MGASQSQFSAMHIGASTYPSREVELTAYSVMKTNFLFASIPAVAGLSSMGFKQPLPCLVQPIASVEAGQVLRFKYVSADPMAEMCLLTKVSLLGSNANNCGLTVSFSDPHFLPITLLAVPQNCSGIQVASFTLPKALGDVYAALQW